MSRTSERHCRLASGLAAIAATLAAGLGQYVAAQEDLTEPPRITGESQAIAAPTDSEPTPAEVNDRTAEIEEIVVVADQNPWRLPDLGSSWRDPLADQADTGRLSADLLPIWNPAAQEMPTREPYAAGESFGRAGFIEIFRVSFGGN